MSPAILTAMDQLNGCINEAEAVGDAVCDAIEAGGANAPAWVWAYRAQVQRIQAASEALETLLRGYRGCAPDGDRAPAGGSDLRGQSGTLPGTDSRLEKQSSVTHE
jgi:hypothetical protein